MDTQKIVAFAKNANGKTHATLNINFLNNKYYIICVVFLIALLGNCNSNKQSAENTFKKSIAPFCGGTHDTLIQLTKRNESYFILEPCDCQVYEIVKNNDTLLLQGGCDVTTLHVTDCFSINDSTVAFTVVTQQQESLQRILLTRTTQNLWFINAPDWSSYDNFYYIEKKYSMDYQTKSADCDE